jgi:hypothetical protein
MYIIVTMVVLLPQPFAYTNNLKAVLQGLFSKKFVQFVCW